jgi:Kef-type K+ transport system membrane component KefB
VPPETQVQLSGAFSEVVSGLSHVPVDEIPALYNESFGALQAVATLGPLLPALPYGLESELEELMAVGAQAFSVAVVGVVLPFALGTLGLMAIFHVDAIPAIFAGASMTATSIGITASVFGELGYLRTREGPDRDRRRCARRHPRHRHPGHRGVPGGRRQLWRSGPSFSWWWRPFCSWWWPCC